MTRAPEDEPTFTRTAKEPRLYGAAEAAEALGVLQQNLRQVPGLPDPYDRIRSTTLWRADEIDALAAKRRRRAAVRKEKQAGEKRAKTKTKVAA